MKKYDLVIIGAGSGGLSAAAGAAKLGLSVLLVEKNKLGGDCLWHGCIPSKTLIHEAEKMQILKEEMLTDEKVGVDFEKHWQEAKKRIVQVENEIAKTDSIERFEGLGCDVIIGEAKFYKKNKVVIKKFDDGKEMYYKFKKCIIATGSRPRVPDIFKSVKYITNENFFNLEKLPKTMTVVGGGSIGVELASAISCFGTKVKMILKEEFVMSKEEKETREFMTEKLRSLGIEIYSNANIKKVFELDGEKCVELENGVILKSEELLVSVGRELNLDLDLVKGRVKFSEQGIEINDYLQTSNKRVYAIGDCNGRLMFTHAAGYQARAVLNNLFVPKFISFFFPFLKKKAKPNAFPWVTYTFPEVAHVGSYQSELELSKTDFKVYTTKLEHVDRAKAGGTEMEGFIQVLVGKNKLYRFKNKGGKILGVTIVAPHAGELITE
jgi:pyruvate/2-oxoglutarate dehydrogenase complex dihydrolipoamide dehydrogenase (E3) component